MSTLGNGTNQSSTGLIGAQANQTLTPSVMGNQAGAAPSGVLPDGSSGPQNVPWASILQPFSGSIGQSFNNLKNPATGASK